MDQYVGVSLKQTWISVRQNRKRIWRGKCLSHPRMMAEAIRQHAPNAVLVVFETLSTWFHHELTACQRCASTHGMPRRRSTPHRTSDRRLSLLAEAGFFREVRVKSWAAMPVRTLVGGRAQLIGISSDLSNQILMRTFGQVVPAGGGRIFEANPARGAGGAGGEHPAPARGVARGARSSDGAQLVAVATVPGVGAVTALSYTTMIENPANFGNSRAVGAFSRRGATNRARSTTTGTSRDAATSTCAPCSTRPRR
jgi:transposase